MSEATDDLKRAAADGAVNQLADGLIVGLGSGSTAAFAVSAMGRRVREGFHVTGIPTSEKTADQARELGIALATLGEHPQVDVTIDGADEVELGTLNLIKGGGGNLLREKIVAAASNQFVIIVDKSKLVQKLGSRSPVPVEVSQFGWQSTAQGLAALGAKPVLRNTADGKAYVTDGGNYILDCGFGPIESVNDLRSQLDATVGVIEHGLFVGMAARVFVASPAGVQILERA